MKEPSHNGRRSQRLCHPGPTIRRPSLERAPLRVLRHRCGFSLELVPARALSAACLTADRRKRHFFGPRRSYRILQHDLTHGHDLYGLLLHSRPGLTAPLRSWSSLARRHVESRVDLRHRLDEPSRAHPPCALLHGNVSELNGPVHARRSRSRHLSPAKTLPYYLRRPTRHPLNFDGSNTGRRSRAKDWHVPLPGCGGVQCEFPSSRASEHPTVADLVRVVLEWIHTRPQPAKTSVPATPREGWRFSESQDVWSRS